MRKSIDHTPEQVAQILEWRVFLSGLLPTMRDSGVGPVVFGAAHVLHKPWALKRLHAFLGLDENGSIVYETGRRRSA